MDSTTRAAVLRRLQRKNPAIRSGGLRAALRAIEERFGLDFDPDTYRAGFAPLASWWDAKNRTLHLYEYEGPAVIPADRLRSIQAFGHDLHAASGCFTKLWVTDARGESPLPVWDVREELAGIHEPGGDWFGRNRREGRRPVAHAV